MPPSVRLPPVSRDFNGSKMRLLSTSKIHLDARYARYMETDMNNVDPMLFDHEVARVLAVRQHMGAQEVIQVLEEVIDQLGRRRVKGSFKRRDRRRRRTCAVCRRFLPAERSSAYCQLHQSQRMIARRNAIGAVEYMARQRDLYEALDPAWRRSMEGWLYSSTRDDPEQHALVLEHFGKFNVDFNPLEYLLGA
jgi:hypothetical protein